MAANKFLLDTLRGMAAPGELAMTLGTSMVDMAGKGLGTMAGMARDRWQGREPDFAAASEGVMPDQFTYQPRTPQAQALMGEVGKVMEPIERGMQWAGEKTTDVTGSPAAGAAVYTALNVVDPQMLVPAAAKAAALRGAQNIARSAKFEPVSSAGIGGKQRGAWSPGDIADVEGDFTMRSTVEDALGKLKPQEQKAKGKQMLAVLKKYGAKEEELRWSGLNKILESDAPVTADEIRSHMAEFGPEIGTERYGASAPGAESKPTYDEYQIEDKAREAVYDSGELQYPYRVTVDGESIGRDGYATKAEAEEALESWKEDMRESEAEYYKENISEYLSDEVLSAMDEAEIDEWAQDRANSLIDENYSYDIDVDYDAEPANFDDLYEYYLEEVRTDPESYGIDSEGGGSGKWHEYVIEGPEGAKGENYGETMLTLTREGNYGRGLRGIDTENTPANFDQYTPFQKARLEALRTMMNDEDISAARAPWTYTMHFPDENPLVYTRESDWPKPPGAETPGSMRMIEELQSDAAQNARKKGLFSPEEAKVARAQLEKTIGPKLDDMRTRWLESVNAVPESELVRYYTRKQGSAPDNPMQQFRSDLNELLGDPDKSPTVKMVEARDMMNELYYAAETSEVEQLARNLQSEAYQLQEGLTGGERGQKVPEMPFIKDTKKATQLALQQAIADAVRRGDQYVGVSPGYVHAPERWGSEDLSWWTPEMSVLPGQEAPQVRQVAARSGSYDKLRGEGWKQTVDALRRGEDVESYSGPRVIQLDLADPQARDQLRSLVESKLGYEASQYADPEQFITDRANKIFEGMLKEAEGQYSPRTHGMTEFYDKMVPSVLAKVLKEAGSTGSGRGVQRFAEAPEGYGYGVGYRKNARGEWEAFEVDGVSAEDVIEKARTDPENYRYEPPRMHYVEIDPELARAAKQGFRLPY